VAQISVVIDTKVKNTGVSESRKIRRRENIARTGEKGNIYRVLVGKPEGKRELVSPSLREDSIN
jgi:hypothetical protein